MSRLRGFSLEAGSLLSRVGRCKASVYSVMLSTCIDCPAHQNREENVNKKREIKNIPVPRQWRQKFDRGGASTLKMCIL